LELCSESKEGVTMNKFIEDLKRAKIEIQDLIDIFENQERVYKTIEDMNLTPEQQKVFINLFLEKGV